MGQIFVALGCPGHMFLGYQSVSLLLETELLAVLMAPWKIWQTRTNDGPWWPTVWLVRWLAFRRMFLWDRPRLGEYGQVDVDTW